MTGISDDFPDDTDASITKAQTAMNQQEQSQAREEQEEKQAEDSSGTQTPKPSTEGPSTSTQDSTSSGGANEEAETPAPQVEPKDQSEVNQNIARRYTMDNGEKIYLLSDGKAHSEKEKDLLSPELRGEMDQIDKDPRYAEPVEVPQSAGDRAGKLVATMAEAFANAYDSKHLAQHIKDVRLGIRALLNGDLLGAVSGTVDASFDALTILGDGVDSFKNAVYKRYGIDPATMVGTKLKQALCRKEIAITREKVKDALEYMARESGKSFGLRDMQKYGIEYNDDLLKEGGMSKEDIQELNDILDMSAAGYGENNSIEVTDLTPQEKADIKYMLYTHDYGYNPELLGSFINRFANKDHGYAGVHNPYTEAVDANETYDFESNLGKYAEYRNREPIDGLKDYYKAILKKQQEIDDKIESGLRGFAYEYEVKDDGSREIKRDELGNPVTVAADKLKPVEVRALDVERKVLAQAAGAIDAQTKGMFSDIRKLEAQRRLQEKAQEKMYAEQLARRYEAEPDGGAYRLLAGSKKNTVQYAYQNGSGGSVPALTFDRYGASMWKVLQKKWEGIKGASGLSDEQLASNKTFVSLYNAWVCTDAYQTRDEWYRLIETIDPSKRAEYEDEIEDWFNKVCTDHKWEGDGIEYRSYTRKDLEAWAKENLGIEYDAEKNNDLNHLITGCGLDGKVTVDSIGGPLFPQAAGTKVNLLANGLEDKIGGLYYRYMTLLNMRDKKKEAMTEDQLIELKRLEVFRAYQLRHQSLTNLLKLVDAPEVKEYLKSASNLEMFRRQILDNVGVPPGWKWQDGDVDLNTYVPSDAEATLESGGYGYWNVGLVGDDHTGRTAALRWLKARYGIDIDIIAQTPPSKGFMAYAEREKKTEESFQGGPIEITPTGYTVADQLRSWSRRFNSRFPKRKANAQHILDMAVNGQISLERMQYMVDNGTIPIFVFEEKGAPQSFKEAAMQVGKELEALETLGFINKGNVTWNTRAKKVIWASLIAPSKDKRSNQFTAFRNRVQNLAVNSDEELRGKISFALNAIEIRVRNGTLANTPEAKAKAMYDALKVAVEEEIDNSIRLSTKKASKKGRAYTDALAKQFPDAHACLQDPDVKEFMVNCASADVKVDPNTGLIHKFSRDSRVNSHYISNMYTKLRLMREDIDEIPEGKDKDEALEKYTKLKRVTDVIDIVHRRIRNKSAKVTVPDGFTEWKPLVAELNDLRSKYGADLSDAETQAFEREWRELFRSKGFEISDKASKLQSDKDEARSDLLAANFSNLGGYTGSVPGDVKDAYDKLASKGGQVPPELLDILERVDKVGKVPDHTLFDPTNQLMRGYMDEKGQPGIYSNFAEGFYTPALKVDENGNVVRAERTFDEAEGTLYGLNKYYEQVNQSAQNTFSNMLYGMHVDALYNDKSDEKSIIRMRGKQSDPAKLRNKVINNIPLTLEDMKAINGVLDKAAKGEIDELPYGLNLEALRECSGKAWLSILSNTSQLGNAKEKAFIDDTSNGVERRGQLQGLVNGALHGDKDACDKLRKYPELVGLADKIEERATTLQYLWDLGNFKDKLGYRMGDKMTAPGDKAVFDNRKLFDTTPISVLNAIKSIDDQRYRGYDHLKPTSGDPLEEVLEEEGDDSEASGNEWYDEDNQHVVGSGDLTLEDEAAEVFTYRPKNAKTKFTASKAKAIIDYIYGVGSRPWGKGAPDKILEVLEDKGKRSELIRKLDEALRTNNKVNTGQEVVGDTLGSLTPDAQMEFAIRTILADRYASLPYNMKKDPKYGLDTINDKARKIFDVLKRNIGQDEEASETNVFNPDEGSDEEKKFKKLFKENLEDMDEKPGNFLSLRTSLCGENSDKIDYKKLYKWLVANADEHLKKYLKTDNLGSVPDALLDELWDELAWRICRKVTNNRGRTKFLENAKKAFDKLSNQPEEEEEDQASAMEKFFSSKPFEAMLTSKSYSNLFNTDAQLNVTSAKPVTDLAKLGGYNDKDSATLNQVYNGYRGWVLDACQKYLKGKGLIKKTVSLPKVDDPGFNNTYDAIVGNLSKICGKDYAEAKSAMEAKLRTLLEPARDSLYKDLEEKINAGKYPALFESSGDGGYAEQAPEIFKLIGFDEGVYSDLQAKVDAKRESMANDTKAKEEKQWKARADIIFGRKEGVKREGSNVLYDEVGSLAPSFTIHKLTDKIDDIVKRKMKEKDLPKAVYDELRKIKPVIRSDITLGAFIDEEPKKEQKRIIKEIQKEIYDYLRNMPKTFGGDNGIPDLDKKKDEWAKEYKKLSKSDGEPIHTGFMKAKTLRPKHHKVLRPKKQ